jgi:dihydroorotate dehydrogenase (fumarate)
MNLATKYLGLELRNPLIVGASPMAATVEGAKRLEEAGASAIVLHSLFEEQVVNPAAAATSGCQYLSTPDSYIGYIRLLKREIGIPVIASLNSLREGAWIRYAQYIQDAGADALELNLYFLPRTDNDSSSLVEERAYQVVRLIRQFVAIPLAVKLSPWITALPPFAAKLEEAGANGIILFNRFIQPDIDIATLKTIPRMRLSDSSELLIRLHWIAAMYKRTRMTLSATGGITTPDDLVKTILVGADATQIVGALLRNEPEYVQAMLEGLSGWMEKQGFETLDQAREKGESLRREIIAAAGRDNYIRMVLNGDIDKS